MRKHDSYQKVGTATNSRGEIAREPDGTPITDANGKVLTIGELEELQK